MAFDWEDYLQMATSLKDKPDKPGPAIASYRTAISRAYYASYHIAYSFATKHGFSVELYHNLMRSQRDTSRPGDAHTYLPIYFRDISCIFDLIPKTAAVMIGTNLDTLRTHRRKADYDCLWSETKITENVGSLITAASTIISDIKQLPQSFVFEDRLVGIFI